MAGDTKDPEIRGALKEAASVVPDVFYDLIGRVPPGALLLISVGWTVVSVEFTVTPAKLLTTLNGLTSGFWTVAVLLGTLFSYAIGLLMSGPGRLWARVAQARHFVNAVESLSKERQAIVDAFLRHNRTRLAEFPIFDKEERRLHFTLKPRLVDGESRILSKMRAEVALTYNLQAAASTAMAFNAVYLLVRRESLERPAEWTLLTFVFLLAFSASYARSRNYYTVELGMLKRDHLNSEDLLKLAHLAGGGEPTSKD